MNQKHAHTLLLLIPLPVSIAKNARIPTRQCIYSDPARHHAQTLPILKKVYVHRYCPYPDPTNTHTQRLPVTMPLLVSVPRHCPYPYQDTACIHTRTLPYPYQDTARIHTQDITVYFSSRTRELCLILFFNHYTLSTNSIGLILNACH